MDIRAYPKNPNYGVTRDGRVFRIVKAFRGRPVPQEIKPTLNKHTGYLFVGKGDGRGLLTTTVHSMVAETYVPRPVSADRLEVAHENNIRTDNRDINLRWDTHKGNTDDRAKHATEWRGSMHKGAKLREMDVILIRSAKEPTRVLATRYGVSIRLINRLRAGEGWTHV